MISDSQVEEEFKNQLRPINSGVDPNLKPESPGSGEAQQPKNRESNSLT